MHQALASAVARLMAFVTDEAHHLVTLCTPLASSGRSQCPVSPKCDSYKMCHVHFSAYGEKPEGRLWSPLPGFYYCLRFGLLAELSICQVHSANCSFLSVSSVPMSESHRKFPSRKHKTSLSFAKQSLRCRQKSSLKWSFCRLHFRRRQVSDSRGDCPCCRCRTCRELGWKAYLFLQPALDLSGTFWAAKTLWQRFYPRLSSPKHMAQLF